MQFKVALIAVVAAAGVDLPEATAYVVTKAVFDEFKRSPPVLANISKESVLAGETVPFTPALFSISGSRD